MVFLWLSCDMLGFIPTGAEHRTLEPGGWLVEVDGGLQGWIDLGITFVLKILGKQKKNT